MVEFSRVNGLKPACGLSLSPSLAASSLGSKFAFDLKFRLNVLGVQHVPELLNWMDVSK